MGGDWERDVARSNDSCGSPGADDDSPLPPVGFASTDSIPRRAPPGRAVHGRDDPRRPVTRRAADHAAPGPGALVDEHLTDDDESRRFLEAHARRHVTQRPYDDGRARVITAGPREAQQIPVDLRS